MNKEEALKKIEELKKFIEKEDKVCVYDLNWRAQPDESYWFVSPLCGVVRHEEWDGDITDMHRYNTGNCFKTKNLAEKIGLKEHKKQEAIMRVKRYIYTEFGEFVPDWEDDNQHKETVMFNAISCKFLVSTWGGYTPACLIACVKKGNMNKVIEACEDDLKIIFDVN